MGHDEGLFVIVFSIVTSIAIIFLLKNMSISETKSLLRPLIHRK
jgi:hypothetical protein